MKKLQLTATLVLTMVFLSPVIAQQIEFKKDLITLDGKAMFKVKGNVEKEADIVLSQSKKSVFTLVRHNLKKDDQPAYYYELHFPGFDLPVNSGLDFEKLVQHLYQNKVITAQGAAAYSVIRDYKKTNWFTVPAGN